MNSTARKKDEKTSRKQACVKKDNDKHDKQ